tara:strand:- start:118 stop:921 length:804 start_codon:yes stop_codon:yes gene_type:complete
MTDNQFNQAKDWFEDLRNQLINTVTEIDGNEFVKTNWKHIHDGGGTMSKIQGPVVEKGGVNISTVSGELNNEMQNKIPGAKKDPKYKATGISVVLHPMSPKIPSMHFNTRFLMTAKKWFGGGMDITPALNFNKIDDYHNGLKFICDEYSPDKYSEFKKWCDDYFYLPHRKEPRGAGGIFFDYLKNNWEDDFEFIKKIGIYFNNFVKNTLTDLKSEKWSEEDKNIQLVKRSRYAEFNLLHDRGTKFGLETGGNIDAILMSMPPLAKWD